MFLKKINESVYFLFSFGFAFGIFRNNLSVYVLIFLLNSPMKITNSYKRNKRNHYIHFFIIFHFLSFRK